MQIILMAALFTLDLFKGLKGLQSSEQDREGAREDHLKLTRFRRVGLDGLVSGEWMNVPTASLGK